MSQYRLHYETTASTYIDVEADSEEEAQEKAYEEFHNPEPCAHCAGAWRHEGEPGGIELGEWEPVIHEWGTEKLS